LIRVDARRILKSFVKICTASAVMGVSGWSVLHGEMWAVSGRPVEKTIYLSGTIVLCLCVYLIISFLLKGDEMNYLYERIKSRLNGRTT
jgi:hypothetical protein